MSQNLCPKCHKPIRLPYEEVTIIRKNLGRGKTLDRMVHKVCPVGEIVELPGVKGQSIAPTYCSHCGHSEQLHTPKCGYANYGYKCDCKQFRR